jgi:hypothetical protein
MYNNRSTWINYRYQSRCCEGNIRSVDLENTTFYRTHYHVHKSKPQTLNGSYMTPVQILTSCFFRIYFNTRLGLSVSFSPSGFPIKMLYTFQQIVSLRWRVSASDRPTQPPSFRITPSTQSAYLQLQLHSPTAHSSWNFIKKDQLANWEIKIY